MLLQEIKEDLENVMGKNDTDALFADCKDEMIMSIEGLDTGIDMSGGYPKIILTIIIRSLNPIVLKWVEENKPKAWYKETFII